MRTRIHREKIKKKNIHVKIEKKKKKGNKKGKRKIAVSMVAWRHVATRRSNYMFTLCGGSSAVAGHHPMVVRLHSMTRLRSFLSRFQKSRPRGPSVNDKNENR